MLSKIVGRERCQEFAVERVSALSPDEFRRAYRGQRPIIIQCGPSREQILFNLKHSLCALAGGRKVPVKFGDIAKGKERLIKINDYISQSTLLHNQDNHNEKQEQLYIHDVSVLEFGSQLEKEVRQFSSDYLPAWYRKAGWQLLRFFISYPGCVTPLHFDTMETHNLFFQIAGRKEFIIVPREYGNRCYIYDWRWSAVNPVQPDYNAHPDFREVPQYRCCINEGEILYLPPRWLHQALSLDVSVSANIDWHTISSALRSLPSVYRGAPKFNLTVNLRHLVGQVFRLPLPMLFPRRLLCRTNGYESPGF